MMRYLSIFLLSSLLIGFLACNNIETSQSIDITYDSPFPKRSQNLKLFLGDQITLKNGNDTITFTIDYDRKTKISTIFYEPDHDTIFNGSASRYKGLIFLNQKINDTAYYIYALEIENNTIKGLTSYWSQMNDIVEYLDLDKFKSIVMYRNDSTHVIRLTPDKKTLKELYGIVLYHTPADTILEFEDNFDIEMMKDTIRNISSDLKMISNEKELVTSYYPNPVSNKMTIELSKSSEYYLKVFDIKGQLVMSSEFTSNMYELEMTGVAKGNYIIAIFDEEGLVLDKFEIVKI